MPLALRLCGCALGNARVRTTPEQLIHRLQLEADRLRHLRELSEQANDVSVEACISSSYTALSPSLQRAFLALSEFPGSFVEAAAGIASFVPVRPEGTAAPT